MNVLMANVATSIASVSGGRPARAARCGRAAWRGLRASLAGSVLLLGLVGCAPDESPLRIGGKDFAENQILSEMMAILAESAEIPVLRRIGLGPTLANLEGLKQGDIDLYAEYGGTGLVMLGQPPTSDGDEAIARVRELYAPLGLVWGERFGFRNNYGLAMTAARAAALGVVTISDLAEVAEPLSIGVDQNFETRPVDGLDPLLARYGIGFADTTVVAPEERVTLYDALLGGEHDVIEVFTTDGQISDLELVLLEDDLDFFPVYEAAPLVRSEALARFPKLQAQLDRLGGALDESLMRRLNSQVEIEGLAPESVARAALVELGLIDGSETLEITEPVRVAVESALVDSDETARALRAVRLAFPERRVIAEPVGDALAAAGRGETRVALASGVEFTGADGSERPFEAAGSVGLAYVHLIAPPGGATSLAEVDTLLSGAPGSSGARTAEVFAAGLPGLQVVATDVGEEPDAEAASAAGADAWLVLAPAGAASPGTLDGGRLIPLTGWSEGNNRVRFPTLREARLPAGTYPGQDEPVETLAAQLLLAGPVVESAAATGPQGPAASAPTDVSPLSDESVQAIAEALGGGAVLDPAVPIADVLRASLPEGPASVNPSPDVSLLTVLVLLVLVWMAWLYARPERR